MTFLCGIALPRSLFSCVLTHEHILTLYFVLSYPCTAHRMIKSASFGPFDRQVVIMNEDGKGFTLLQNPQAMRLKKAGLIKDRQFVRQPTEEELETALEAEGPSIGAAFQGLFGGGD